MTKLQGCACKFLYGPGTDEDKKEELEKARKTSYETKIDYSMQALEAKDELQMEVQLYKKNGELNFETGRKTVKVKYFNSAH